VPPMPSPTFFATPADWRAWLEANHATAAELSVGFWKTGSAQPSITWPESVDEALCFGWIDGVRHRIDETRYRIRFTPRKRAGNWSQVNLKRFAELAAQGRIAPAGQAAFDARRSDDATYSYEKAAETFTDEEISRFQADPAAWTQFQAFPPSYRKVAVHRVVSAKSADTRAKRLDILIDATARGLRLQSPTKVWRPDAEPPL